MPFFDLNITTVVAKLEDEVELLWPLIYPDAIAIGRNRGQSQRLLALGVKELLKNTPTLEHYRFRTAPQPALREVVVEISPPEGNRLWLHAVKMGFPALIWRHGTERWLAYVPALDLHVLARREDEFHDLLPKEIHYGLLREQHTVSLGSLLQLARLKNIEVDCASLRLRMPTLRERELERNQAKAPQVLRQVAVNLTSSKLPPVFQREDAVNRLADLLLAKNPRSVLLVGESGVGKTAVVHELARTRLQKLNPQRPLWSTGGAQIVAGMSGFGMWQERCQQICREAQEASAILHLGNLVELMEVGKHEGNLQGVASFLRPIMARGELLAITECTPQQLAVIEQRAPAMLDCFTQMPLAPADAVQTLSILREHGAYHQAECVLPEQALELIVQLHQRYATYSANPGRPLRFFVNLLEDIANESLNAGRVAAAFSRETGLPDALLNDAVPLDLTATRHWLASRVIGQDDAVDLVVDLLATVKARLSRPQRPIASLLFIGPTGVGKTEMAKSLAEFFYQDPQRMVRIDMSEYADYSAVDRLIGGSFQQEGLLTSQVREQPFGVVLLDEFEKAHPRVFDLLLQVLGEGRLTDAAGRMADFTNSVIIMTSNLGAEQLKKAELGFEKQNSKATSLREMYLSAVREKLRPEMFNRIDRIVPFDSLSEGVLCQIAQRELRELRKRSGIRYRNVRLKMAESLPALLAQIGYDPRYGARPLKRAVERSLLAPLAAGLNEFSAAAPLIARVEAQEQAVKVHVRGRKQQEHHDQSNVAEESAALAMQASEVRRTCARTQASHAVIGMQNDHYRLQSQQQRDISRGRNTPQAAERLRIIADLEKMLARCRQAARQSEKLEERLLLACYAEQPCELSAAGEELSLISQEVDSILLDLYAAQCENANDLILAVYAEDAASLGELACGYWELCGCHAAAARVYALHPLTDSARQLLPQGMIPLGLGSNWTQEELRKTARTVLLAERLSDPSAALAAPKEDWIGVLLDIHGSYVFPLLDGEGGTHLWQTEPHPQWILVNPAQSDLENYFPPERIDRKGAIGHQSPRRVYEVRRQIFEDTASGVRKRWTAAGLGEPLYQVVLANLVNLAKRWLFQ